MELNQPISPFAGLLYSGDIHTRGGTPYQSLAPGYIIQPLRGEKKPCGFQRGLKDCFRIETSASACGGRHGTSLRSRAVSTQEIRRGRTPRSTCPALCSRSRPALEQSLSQWQIYDPIATSAIKRLFDICNNIPNSPTPTGSKIVARGNAPGTGSHESGSPVKGEMGINSAFWMKRQ
jgi:hypothetical protein